MGLPDGLEGGIVLDTVESGLEGGVGGVVDVEVLDVVGVEEEGTSVQSQHRYIIIRDIEWSR